ncbi:IDEAL domain-containing protein [Domibacillus indicus]|uniref:IDEAL domain-containing protein n=1 Tax=Domibacillus indicus TaxID=1437523 RepID=UPI000617E4F9|nr:IDEAL domain-containing protein [Domibacillus indicus]
MLKMGEWKTIKIGDATAIGYISNINNYSCPGDCVEFTKVGWIIGGIIEWRRPTQGIYESNRLRSAVRLLDQYQDKTILIDLALATRDKQWFEQLTQKRPGCEETD